MRFSKAILLFLTCISLAAAFPSCSARDADMHSGNDQNGVSVLLTGTVFSDKENMRPVMGIKVRIEGYSQIVETKADGVFLITQNNVLLNGDYDNLYLYMEFTDPSGVYESQDVKIENLFVADSYTERRNIEILLLKK